MEKDQPKNPLSSYILIHQLLEDMSRDMYSMSNSQLQHKIIFKNNANAFKQSFTFSSVLIGSSPPTMNKHVYASSLHTQSYMYILYGLYNVL